MPLRRKIEQWRNGDPEAMAMKQSRAAIFYAFQDARADILALYALAERVARLNPAAGEIGAVVEQARNLTNLTSST